MTTTVGNSQGFYHQFQENKVPYHTHTQRRAPIKTYYFNKTQQYFLKQISSKAVQQTLIGDTGQISVHTFDQLIAINMCAAAMFGFFTAVKVKMEHWLIFNCRNKNCLF